MFFSRDIQLQGVRLGKEEMFYLSKAVALPSNQQEARENGARKFIANAHTFTIIMMMGHKTEA